MLRNRIGFKAIVIAVILYLFTLPYFFWPFENPYTMAVLSLLLIFLLWPNLKMKEIKENDKFLFVFLALCSVFYMFVSQRNPFAFITIIPSLLIPFAHKMDKDIYNSYVTIYAFLMGLSLIVYVLSLFGLIAPYGTMMPRIEEKRYFYYVYPFMVIGSDVGARFCGLFDEPGVVGTTSALLLFLERNNIKNWKFVIILLSGICSMSLFFFVLVTIWYIYRLIGNINIKKIIISLIVIPLAGYVLLSTPVFEEHILSRLEYDSNNGITGDNRIDYLMVASYFNSMSNSEKLFGTNNKKYYTELTLGSSSIFNVIILYGVIFVVWYILFFIIYGFSHKKSITAFFIFIFLFMATIYQRPNIFNPLYVFLFVMLSNAEILQKDIKNVRKRIKRNYAVI